MTDTHETLRGRAIGALGFEKIPDSIAWLKVVENVTRALSQAHQDGIREGKRQAAAAAEAERLGRDDTDSANLLSIIADIREKSGLGAKPMLGDLAGAIAERIANAEREGKRQAAEIVLAYPPNGFFERLSEATKENSDYETMTFEGDEGNWAYLMSVLLQPYAATITDEAE